VRIDRVITNGVFSLDGEDFDVENNIWLVGDDDEVVIIDAAHQAAPIVEAVAGRSVVALICTHGHNDHVNAAEEVVQATHAPVWIHGADRMLWDVVHPHRSPDGDLHDGQRIEVGGATLEVLHTPGHSPGGCCLLLDSQGVLFSGDTLFNGGPGATGRSFSDRAELVDSIRRRLLELPADTVVHTGHGDDTTIGAELTGSADW